MKKEQLTVKCAPIARLQLRHQSLQSLKEHGSVAMRGLLTIEAIFEETHKIIEFL